MEKEKIILKYSHNGFTEDELKFTGCIVFPDPATIKCLGDRMQASEIMLDFAGPIDEMFLILALTGFTPDFERGFQPACEVRKQRLFTHE